MCTDFVVLPVCHFVILSFCRFERLECRLRNKHAWPSRSSEFVLWLLASASRACAFYFGLMGFGTERITVMDFVSFNLITNMVQRTFRFYSALRFPLTRFAQNLFED